MFGIGPTELLVILVVALLLLGPKRLPELARSVGKAMGEFKRATADIQTELDNARIMLEEETRAVARAEAAKKGRGHAETAKLDEPTKPAAAAEPTVARQAAVAAAEPAVAGQPATRSGADSASAGVEDEEKSA